ncbi:RTA1 domain-containing protein [Aspergillus vadensis CBS 113365]|uniref:RTA1 domain protein n=1 Tax=Aspergillus vadensis (strain CBS 113365 / IMI 142717 / IBT 24658) TaxID=1448311 RepID=A0A319BPQ8_ASPVC|nr:RTA1 domain protein [Aspergillus vadensis CBS 113365]PYH73150.1 RTA1 domain protein [Aspergillus vadensis CBS 113365]
MDFQFHPGVNGSAPYVDFYPYTPSETAGYAFMAIFGLATLVHFAMMFPYRAAYFIPLVIGGICETFGYYGRAWSHQGRTLIGPWALQEMLILCAPPFIAATVYMILGRMIVAFAAEHHSVIRPKWLTKIFVLNDVICFLTQIGGAGVQVTGDEHLMKTGIKAVLAGLIFSLVIFLLFVWVAIVFHLRLSREPTWVVNENPWLMGGWKRYMWALYVACGALMLRNLVRTVQFGANETSPLNTQEVYIYVFDAALMFVSMAVLAVYHPGTMIKRARRTKEAAEYCQPMADIGDEEGGK